MTFFPRDTTMSVKLPEQLVPAGPTLVLNTRTGLLACTVGAEGGEGIGRVEGAQLTGEEARVLSALLSRVPCHCPYEIALAALTYPTPGEGDVARCRQRLRLARDEGYWGEELALLRSILSALKGKMQALGLTIVAVLGTGYLLQPCLPSGPTSSGDGARP
jgi:hypothetical protein